MIKIDVFDIIDSKFDKMSKSQKRIALYLKQNFEKAVFMTADTLGKEVGVSESTVVRFASMLGFEGYGRLQTALSEHAQKRMGVSGRLTVDGFEDKNNSLHGEIGRMKEIMTKDAQNILDTLAVFPYESMETAVTMLNEAKTIYVVGLRSCAPLASFLAFYLNMLRGNVVLLQTTSLSELFEQMVHISQNDVIVGISFPRYSLRTLRALEFAKERRANIITITDSEFSPLNMYSLCNLWAKSDMISIVDSLVAPLSVINALLVTYSLKYREDTMHNLKCLEEVWENYQTYEKDELMDREEEDWE